MIVLYGVHQVVHHLLQGFDVSGGGGIALPEGLSAEVQDGVDDLSQHLDLIESSLGEVELLFMEGHAHLTDVHGVVAETFKLRDGGVVVGHDLQVVGCGDVGGDLNQVVADPVRHGVNVGFILADLLRRLLIVVYRHVKGAGDVGAGHLVHFQKGIIAAAEGQGRGAEEHRA